MNFDSIFEINRQFLFQSNNVWKHQSLVLTVITRSIWLIYNPIEKSRGNCLVRGKCVRVNFVNKLFDYWQVYQ